MSKSGSDEKVVNFSSYFQSRQDRQETSALEAEPEKPSAGAGGIVTFEPNETMQLLFLHSMAVGNNVFKDYGIEYTPSRASFYFIAEAGQASLMSIHKTVFGETEQIIFKAQRTNGVTDYVHEVVCDKFSQAMELAREEVRELFELICEDKPKPSHQSWAPPEQ